MSVSRMHAWIKFKPDGKFYLMDNKSKFGTLVLLREDLKLGAKATHLQVANMVISLSVKQKKVSSSPQLLQPKRPTTTPKKDQIIIPREDVNHDPFSLDHVFYS